MNDPCGARFPARMRAYAVLWVLGLVVATWGFLPAAAFAQGKSQPGQSAVRGVVVDTAGKPVVNASVLLSKQDGSTAGKTKTSSDGAFSFAGLDLGSYSVSAEKAGLRGRADVVFSLAQGEQKHIDLALRDAAGVSPTQAMEFADQPDFTVAGVTDWTAVGGHGSDSALRTSEALARETLTLKPDAAARSSRNSDGKPGDANSSEESLRANLAKDPESFEANHQLGEFYFAAGKYRESIPLLKTAYQKDPSNHGNEYDLALAYKETGDFHSAAEHANDLLAHENSADLHRLSGEIDEKLDNPLAAVHEDEQAVRLDPSEQNYFAWGSELLLHRAVHPAIEVFREGSKAHPKSARMLAALGAALFSGAFYDEAALRLCDASDLNPADTTPYVFLGNIEMAAPKPLPCAENKLARFAREQPDNALANYLYAMSIWKRQKATEDPAAMQHVEALLTKAVTLDSKCADGYLQLGVLYFSQRNLDKAIAEYEKAIEADPQLGEAHYRLGVAYDRVGNPAKATQEFQLHDQIEKIQADAVERQRREVRQFLIVLNGKPALR